MSEDIMVEDNDLFEVAKGVLETLLERMGIEASVELQGEPGDSEESSGDQLTFDVMGDDLGILIGRRGQTLASLQFMVRLIVSHQTKRWVPIVVDIESYRRRRSEKLEALAERLADQVRERGRPFTLRPMLPYERRIIHLALADHPNVTTESIGEGESRRVVIRPQR
jgi:spoIIIJ-associated protein